MPLNGESPLQFLLFVVAPPPGVTFAVQRGRAELLTPFAVDVGSIAFAFTMRLGSRPDGSFNFLGPFAQGSPADRFVYLNSGASAGQVGTHWQRRAKLMLAGISLGLVEAAADAPDLAIEARVQGTMRDGGPICASVKPPAIAWRLAKRGEP